MDVDFFQLNRDEKSRGDGFFWGFQDFQSWAETHKFFTVVDAEHVLKISQITMKYSDRVSHIKLDHAIRPNLVDGVLVSSCWQKWSVAVILVNEN